MSDAAPTTDAAPHVHRHHWYYVWFPLVAAFAWFATLWALLITVRDHSSSSRVHTA